MGEKSVTVFSFSLRVRECRSMAMAMAKVQQIADQTRKPKMGNPGEDQKFRGGGNVTRSHAYVKFVACFESDILFLRLGGKLVQNVTLSQ